MLEHIKKAIDSAIEEAINEEFEQAKIRLDARKAEIVAGVVLQLQKEVRFDQHGEVLNIQVSYRP